MLCWGWKGQNKNQKAHRSASLKVLVSPSILTGSGLALSHIERKVRVWKESQAAISLLSVSDASIDHPDWASVRMLVCLHMSPLPFILISQTLQLHSMQLPTPSSSLFSTQWTFFSRSCFNLFLLRFLPHFFLPMARSHTTFTPSFLPARLLSSPSARLSQLYFSARFLDSLICLLLLGCKFFSTLYFLGAGPLPPSSTSSSMD